MKKSAFAGATLAASALAFLFGACATGELRDAVLDEVPDRVEDSGVPTRPDTSPGDVSLDDNAGVDATSDSAETSSDVVTAPDADMPDVADTSAPDVESDVPCTPGAPGCEPLPPIEGCCERVCEGAACTTVAGSCEDRCEFQLLSIDALCSGCGASDAEGVCEYAAQLRCDADNAELCLQATCGGQGWYCTESGGVWGWRTLATCDDDNACSLADTCVGGTCGGSAYSCAPTNCPAGRCDGNTFIEYPDSCDRDCDGLGGCTPCECIERPKPCSTGAGNVCCAAACDPVLGCTTTATSCGADVCTNPNLLQLAGTCSGCGGENGSGTCSAPTQARCDAVVNSPCQQSSCGGTTYTCTNAGGTWQWRTGTTCDDGNNCTWGDSCSAGACRGTTVTCADTTCLDRECNGSATCSETPLTGATCNDGNACTAVDACSAAGICVGSGSAAVCGDGVCNCAETNATCAADCPITLPTNACANGAQTRDGCGNARIIGRAPAAAGWSSGEQNTCASGARNRHEGDCGGIFDVGFDHTHAIYMLAGERVTVTLAVGTRECASGEYFNSRLKFKFNGNTTTAGATSCPTTAGCWSGPREDESRVDTRTYDATTDGWLFVIVDGGATAFDEHRGYYTIGVTLSRCGGAGCGC